MLFERKSLGSGGATEGKEVEDMGIDSGVGGA